MYPLRNYLKNIAGMYTQLHQNIRGVRSTPKQLNKFRSSWHWF